MQSLSSLLNDNFVVADQGSYFKGDALQFASGNDDKGIIIYDLKYLNIKNNFKQ